MSKMSQKRKRLKKEKSPRPSSDGASAIVGKDVDSSREKIIEKNEIIRSTTDVGLPGKKIIEKNEIISSITDVGLSGNKIIENNGIISEACQETDALSMPSCIGGNLCVENCKNSCAKHLELDGNTLEKVSVKNFCITEKKAGHYQHRVNKHKNNYVRNSVDKKAHVENMLDNKNRFQHYQCRVNDHGRDYFYKNCHHAKGSANYNSRDGHGKNKYVERIDAKNWVEFRYYANGVANGYSYNQYHQTNGDANYSGRNSVDKNMHVGSTFSSENRIEPYQYHANGDANYNGRNSGDKNMHVGSTFFCENRIEPYQYNANGDDNYNGRNSGDKNMHAGTTFYGENRIEPYQYHENGAENFYFLNQNHSANGDANDSFYNGYHHANGDTNYNGCNSGDKNMHVWSTFYCENRFEPYPYHANGAANFYSFKPYYYANGDANHYGCDIGERNIHAGNMFNAQDRIEPNGYHNIQVGTFLPSPSKRKLLILDLNGLLADIIMGPIKSKPKPDLRVKRKSVFKRPFCDQFLQFCFKNFDIAVWSSRRRDNVDLVVNFLMPKLKNKLVFCWDQSHCTETGFKTVDDKRKPLMLKELKKVWDKKGPNLTWPEGHYNPTNTLLLDDSPYKALCNPEYTGVFPPSYSYSDRSDCSLGPGGNLRVYLEGLLQAEDVPSFVKSNPFGQHHITNSDPHWPFYMRIIQLVDPSTLSSDYTDNQPNPE